MNSDPTSNADDGSENDWESQDLVIPDAPGVRDTVSWGDEFLRLGMIDAAIEEYGRALARDPENPDLISRLDAAKTRSNEAPDSDVIVSVRSFSEAFSYGNDANKVGRYCTAVAALTVASALEPTRPDVWAALGAALRHNQDPGRAIDAYNVSLAHGGGTPALVGLAAAYRDTKDYPEATRRLNEVLVDEPDNPYALNTLGAVYADMKRNDKAEECFTRAAENRSGLKVACSGLLRLAKIYEGTGDYEGVQRVRRWLDELGIEDPTR